MHAQSLGIFSKNNPDAKEIKRIPLFEIRSKQAELLSTALNADNVRKYIQKESANTVLLTVLFKSVERDAQRILIKKRNGTELENNIKKRVPKIIKTFLYEPSIESFAEDVRISESAGMKENCG